MICRPDKKVMQALAMLRSNQHFELVRLWLADSLAQTHEDGSRAKDVFMVRWRQGQAQDLEELLKLIEQSKNLN
jgi:hypothetical protein